MTIHAYTEPRGPNPAYINISERVSNPGDVIVTVRSSGENNASAIILGPEQLRQLVGDAQKHIDNTKQAASALTPHQQRVVVEKAELDEKHRRLRLFLISDMFARLDEAEQGRLQFQVIAMKVYSDILGERIAAFAPT